VTGEQLCEQLGLCNCGNPDEIGDYLLETLSMCNRNDWGSIDYDDMARMLALHLLDQGELIEHGGTIRCSWPTGRGLTVLGKDEGGG